MREREYSLIFFNIKRKHRSHETTRLKKKKKRKMEYSTRGSRAAHPRRRVTSYRAHQFNVRFLCVEGNNGLVSTASRRLSIRV